MKMKKTIFFALLCILSVSLVYADNNQSMESDQMIKKAQATNKIAIKLKNEWRDTRKLIKSAKKAHRRQKNDGLLIFLHDRSKCFLRWVRKKSIVLKSEKSF